MSFCHWPSQEPIKIGGTDSIYKAYSSGLCKKISAQKMAKHMVLTYLHFRILEIPLILVKIGLGRELVNPIYHHLPVVKGVVSNPSINQPTNGNLGHLWL